MALAHTCKMKTTAQDNELVLVCYFTISFSLINSFNKTDFNTIKKESKKKR